MILTTIVIITIVTLPFILDSLNSYLNANCEEGSNTEVE